MEININELCYYLEAVASVGKKVKVEYFNGLKPSGYHAPKIVTTKMALSGMADKIVMAWYSEIFVDGVCIFRECCVPENDDFVAAEKVANDKLIKSIFCYGVMSSKKFLEDFKNKYNV
jgi:hypothetical protein